MPGSYQPNLKYLAGIKNWVISPKYTIPTGFCFVGWFPSPGLTSGSTGISCLRHFRVYTINKISEIPGVYSRHTGFGQMKNPLGLVFL